MTDASAQNGFCRDCLEPAPPGERCPSCHSPRLIHHRELGDLSIAHIDCDAFFAAVEKRDNPELRDKPVIIGGGKRGVVSTACYIARINGVHSAMPMFKALKACPDAVVLRPSMAKYAAVGREIRDMMRSLTPLVEPVSIDEAFLDLTGTERLHGLSPARSVARLAVDVERDIGITLSIGLSYNKFLAKVASDLDKPRGFSVIGRGDATAFLNKAPVGIIWGVGKALRAKLARNGIRTIAQLQLVSKRDLASRYGVIGLRLYDLARGQDDRKVTPQSQTKSISAETTFNTDISDFVELETQLWRLCEKVAGRCKSAGLAGRTTVLKMKTADFRTLTRSHSLDDPTQLADRMFRALNPLLADLAQGAAYRLIGVGVTQLCDDATADQPALFDPEAAKHADAEHAIDLVRAKFGEKSLGKGLGFTPRKKDLT